MFHLNDWAVEEQSLEIMEDECFTERDGFIWWRHKRDEMIRGRFNACELFLMWRIEDAFGVQRVKLGNAVPLTRKQWKRKLNTKQKGKDGKWVSYATQVIAERATQVREIFLGEAVTFELLGWTILRAKFWVEPAGIITLDPMLTQHTFKVESLDVAEDQASKMEKGPNGAQEKV